MQFAAWVAAALFGQVLGARKRSRLDAHEYAPQSVQDALDNHLEAFKKQDLKQIALDYDEDTVVTAYFPVADRYTTFTGPEQINEAFAGIFKQLTNLSSLEQPVLIVEEKLFQVFQVWGCPDMGFEAVHSVFLFTDKFKLARVDLMVIQDGKQQTALPILDVSGDDGIGITQVSVAQSWRNHARSFIKQDLKMAMTDYTENSQVRLYFTEDKTDDNGGDDNGGLVTYVGKKEIQTFYTWLFAELKDELNTPGPVLTLTAGIPIPAPSVVLVKVSETEEEPKHAALGWRAPGPGFSAAFDNIIFDEDFKVLRQNLVIKGIKGAATRAQQVKDEGWEEGMEVIGR